MQAKLKSCIKSVFPLQIYDNRDKIVIALPIDTDVAEWTASLNKLKRMQKMI